VRRPSLHGPRRGVLSARALLIRRVPRATSCGRAARPPSNRLERLSVSDPLPALRAGEISAGTASSMRLYSVTRAVPASHSREGYSLRRCRFWPRPPRWVVARRTAAVRCGERDLGPLRSNLVGAGSCSSTPALADPAPSQGSATTCRRPVLHSRRVFGDDLVERRRGWRPSAFLCISWICAAMPPTRARPGGGMSSRGAA